MALNIKREEAEAIFLLKGANTGAWDILVRLFKRKWRQEQDKCVDTQRDRVEIHQGMAKVFRDLTNIEEEAQKVHDAENK